MKTLVAGHICLDITPVFGEQSHLGLLSPGKLINVGRPDIHLGGSVSNTGLAMQFFGADVRLAAKIGGDEFGQLVRSQLRDYGCEVVLSEDKDAGTSYSIVIAIPGSDRIFLHDPGANNSFVADDISDEMLEGVGHLHFGYPPLMEKMYANGGSELEKLFSRAKKRGITTSLDMAAVDPNAPAGKVDWHGILKRILPLTDYFLPSVEELCFMLDRPAYDEWSGRCEGGDVIEALNVERDIAPLAARAAALGAGTVIIKCGSLGIFCDEGFVPSFKPDSLVSATGAGDTCIAAFLTSILSGQSLSDSVRLAAAAGASCLSSYDALSGLLPLDELQRRIGEGWEANA